MTRVYEIRLHEPIVDCYLCGKETPFRWGAPTYNGDLVSNDFPGGLDEHRGNQAVCQRCHEEHEADRVPTFDHWYVGKR